MSKFSICSLLCFVSYTVVRVHCNGDYSPILHSNPLKIVANWAFDHVPLNTDDVEYTNDVARALKKNWVHQETLHKMLKRATGHGNTSCAHSIEKFAMDLAHKVPYALKMFDSWGKPESGILMGNIHWIGRYYECSDSSGEDFEGKWFSMLVPIHSDVPTTALPSQKVGIELGACFPDSCSSENISDLFYGILTNHTKISLDVTSPPKPRQWNGLDVFALILTICLVILVIIGTVCDLLWKNEQFHGYLTNDDYTTLVPGSDTTEVPIYARVLKTFSLIENVRNLMNTEKKKGNIHCLHGLRFISMTWVLLGHVFAFAMPYINNPNALGRYLLDNVSSMAITSGTFSVDTFFFLSGLLVAYLGMRELNRSDGKLNVPLMYFHRFMRLTPPYAFVILFSSSLYGLLSTGGPRFTSNAQNMKMACQKYWWTNLLYINNLHPATLQDECNGYGWYLANDMQFYLLSPIFLLLLHRRPKLGMAIMGAVTLVSTTITGAISSYYNQPPGPVFMAKLAHVICGDKGVFNQTLTGTGNATASTADKFGSDIYGKPWFRIGVYLVGMVTGYIIHVTNGSLKLSKPAVVLGWLLTAALELTLVYGLYAATDPPFISVNAGALYNAVSRPLWAVGLAWVCVACTNGYGGLVDRFLSWKVFIPLSRLTYTCYLVHPLILDYLMSTQEVFIHFSLVLISVYFLAAVVLANGVGFILSMLVEAPVGSLQRVFLRRKVDIPARTEEADIIPNHTTPDHNHTVNS